MNSGWLTFLANHLWQSTVFAGAVGLLTLAFRGNRAPVRYALWLAASLKFLVPISLLVAAAGYLAPPPAASPTPSAWLPVIDQISRPFAPSAQAPVLSRNRPVPRRVPSALFLVWLGGVAFNLYGWSRHWLRVCAAIGSARPLPIGAPIPVMSTRSGIEPGVFGILRPVLLVPDGILARLTPQQFDAVLIHELSHVRRRDNLAAAAHMLVEALVWFHPLVWWIEDRLIEERERACDEEVLGRISDPQSYAEGILRVCRSYVESPLPCIAGVTGSDLKKRIEMIMTQPAIRKLNPGRKALLAAAALACAITPMVIGRAQSQAGKPASFDVISIKSDSGGGPVQLNGDIHPGGRFHAKNIPLLLLISQAYDLPFRSPRLTGLPEWASTEAYDVDAAPAEGAIPPGLYGKALEARVRPMLQSMLADRFKLVIRRETKDLPIYAITVGKDGPKLKRAEIEEKDCPDSNTAGACHNINGGMGRGLHGKAVDLDDVALFVANWTDRPLVNRTGLTGLYAVETEGWVRMEPAEPRSDGTVSTEGDANADLGRPTVFMIFNRLGLNLEPTKGPVDMYIVLHVERPTAN